MLWLRAREDAAEHSPQRREADMLLQMMQRWDRAASLAGIGSAFELPTFFTRLDVPVPVRLWGRRGDNRTARGAGVHQPIRLDAFRL